MIRNVGSIDKIIRLVLGVGLAAWVFLGLGIGSTMSYIALIVAAVLVTTGLLNFCPLFKILGINSNKS